MKPSVGIFDYLFGETCTLRLHDGRTVKVTKKWLKQQEAGGKVRPMGEKQTHAARGTLVPSKSAMKLMVSRLSAEASALQQNMTFESGYFAELLHAHGGDEWPDVYVVASMYAKSLLIKGVAQPADVTAYRDAIIATFTEMEGEYLERLGDLDAFFVSEASADYVMRMGTWMVLELTGNRPWDRQTTKLAGDLGMMVITNADEWKALSKAA